ncbi:MAG TPA: nucleotidyl transferase AbiEii/AbiGii toxin family protein [Arachidicoccus sp.]|nr:nucleotidyl transferase AbiEii/AbiGii toxin family protein [Arachidicoccus sp.]
MIDVAQILDYFPAALRPSVNARKHMLKEYLQLMILDYISTSPLFKKMSFIGGTNLRLVKGIDRFSEDLDFDCTDLSKEAFTQLTNAVVQFMTRSGWRVETKEKENPKLVAYRRNLYFPELLFDLGLNGHKEERYLIKAESQDQLISYEPENVFISGCGFTFELPVPSDGVLCSMKIAAMLSRAKGRDFYDLLFLLGRTRPDYDFLMKRCGIGNLEAFKRAVKKLLETVDLNKKQTDFEHLLFNKSNSAKILRFGDFVDSLK